VDWNGQEKFSLSCELWVGTNDFNKEKIPCPFQSTDSFPEWKLAFWGRLFKGRLALTHAGLKFNPLF
jgi:hypothetical protein